MLLLYIKFLSILVLYRNLKDKRVVSFVGYAFFKIGTKQENVYNFCPFFIL